MPDQHVTGHEAGPRQHVGVVDDTDDRAGDVERDPSV